MTIDVDEIHDIAEKTIAHFKADELEITKDNPTTGKKERVLTEKQKAFLHHLETEAQGDVKKAMELAGYSSGSRPSEVIKALTDEILEITNRLIAATPVKAVTKLVGVLDDPVRPGNKEIISAAKELLDRAGVFKKDQNSGGTNIRTDAVFILPAKESIDKPKLVIS